VGSVDIIRAWKDAEYRQSLTAEQRAALPDNPAGLAELSEEELAQVAGANNNTYWSPCYPSTSTCSGRSWCTSSYGTTF
jgi:mersacidin/lichenicidin family type 2 lantibiotic